MPPFTVGIAGFTGKFARLLALSLLKRDPTVRLRGLARSPEKVDRSLSSVPNLEIFQGDAFETDKLRKFVRGCDIVVCCYLGDEHLMTEGQKKLIDVSAQEGVSRYCASDWSGDWTKLKMGEHFAKEPCQRIKEYLDKQSRIKGLHILVGGFTDVLMAPFFQIWDKQTLTLRYWGTGDEPWEMTTYQNAAQYTAAAILDPKAAGVLRFAGDVQSTKEIAQTFEEVYGLKPKLECRGSLSELHTVMTKDRKKYGADFYKYVFWWYHYFTLTGKWYIRPNLDNQQHPDIKPVTMEDFMKTRDWESLDKSIFPWESKTITGQQQS